MSQPECDVSELAVAQPGGGGASPLSAGMSCRDFAPDAGSELLIWSAPADEFLSIGISSVQTLVAEHAVGGFLASAWERGFTDPIPYAGYAAIGFPLLGGPQDDLVISTPALYDGLTGTEETPGFVTIIPWDEPE